MLPTQSSGSTPQTPPRSTTERGEASPPKGGGGQTGPEAPVRERQTRQGQAAAKTETKRTGARKALSDYNGKVRKHQQGWVRENRGKFKAQSDQQAAQQSAWDGSQEGQEAKQTLLMPLTEYNGAVEHELRLAADSASGDAEGIRQAVEKKGKEIQARTSGGAEDKILDDVVDRAAPRVAGESPEMRSQALDLAKLISTRDQAAANLKAIQERRDRDLASVTSQQWREKINEGSQAEIKAAQKVLTDSEQALASALKRELSIDVASNALMAAKLGLENVGNLPADRQPIAQVAAVARVEGAQRQFDQVRAGAANVKSFTPEQVDQALQSVLARHPELMSKENAPLATDLFVSAESLKVGAKIDTSLATLSSAPNTPDWMKKLIATDKVTAAMATSLGVQTAQPNGSAEEALAKGSPLTFAVLKYTGGARFEMPAGTMANPAPTDVVRAGQQEVARRLEALKTSDPNKFAQLQLLMLAAGDARISYIRAEWQKVVAAETPEQSVEKMLGTMLREKDFNNPDYTPPTEIGKFMKTLSIGMQASFTPDQQVALWNAVSGDVTSFIGRQADHIKTRYGQEFARYPTVTGEWMKQMGQYATPPVAGVLVDATMARVDPTLMGRPGGGRIMQGLQILGDRAPQSVGRLANWLASHKELPIRQIIPVQRDGTGVMLSQALIAQYRKNGLEPGAVADMEDLYKASIEDLVEERGGQAVTEQFNMFTQNREVNLRNIFDTALRDGGTLFTQKHAFGNDPAADAAYGQRLGLAPDNANPGPGQAQYTDLVKLARIRELKQIDLVSRALNLPVDMNAITAAVANGQPLPQTENLQKIDRARAWIRDIGGQNATVTFTPAVYASQKHGVSTMQLIRVEGDRNNNGAIAGDEAGIIDASMLTAAIRGQNVAWRYADFDDFQKSNLLDDEGKLYLTGSPDLLLHDANGDGRVDNINLEGVDAAITTGWETTRRWGDVVIGVAGLVAGVVIIVGSGGLAAPLVLVGASAYGVARTAETAVEMGGHGQSFNPINTQADGAWLGFIDPQAGGLWLGGIASASGLAALRPLALGRSLVGLSQTGTLARGASTTANVSSNIGTELFLTRGLQSSIYQAQLATVPRSIAVTAEVAGVGQMVGQGQDFAVAAAKGQIDWTDWSINSSTWDFTLASGGFVSTVAGYSASRARSRAQQAAATPGDPVTTVARTADETGGQMPLALGETPPAGETGPVVTVLQGDETVLPPVAKGETAQPAAQAEEGATPGQGQTHTARVLETQQVVDPDNFWPNPHIPGEKPMKLNPIERVAYWRIQQFPRKQTYSAETYKQLYDAASPEVRAQLPKPGTLKPDEMTLLLAEVPGGLENLIGDIHAHNRSYAREDAGRYIQKLLIISGRNARILFGSIPQFCGGDAHYSNAQPSPGTMRNAQMLDAQAIAEFRWLFQTNPALAAKADLSLTGFDFSDHGGMDVVGYGRSHMVEHPGLFPFIGEVTGKKELVSVQMGPFAWDVTSPRFQDYLRFANETGQGVLLHYDWGEHAIDGHDAAHGHGRPQPAKTAYENFPELIEVLSRPEYSDLNIVFAHTGIGRFVRPDSELSPFTRPDGSVVQLPEHIHKLYELFEKIPNARADISWNDVTQAYADNPHLREGLIAFVIDNQDRLLFGSDTVKPANSGQYNQGLNTGSPMFVEIARRNPDAAWKLLRGNYETVMNDAYSRVAAWTRRQPEMTNRRIAEMDMMLDTLQRQREQLAAGARQDFDRWLAMVNGERTGAPDSDAQAGVYPYLYESLPPGEHQHWHDDVDSQTGRGTAGGFAQEDPARLRLGNGIAAATGLTALGGGLVVGSHPGVAEVFNPASPDGPGGALNASAFEARALMIGLRALHGEALRIEHEAIFEQGHVTRQSLDQYVSRIASARKVLDIPDDKMLRISAATEQFWANYQYLRDIPIDNARGWTQQQRFHAIMAKAGEYIITLDRELGLQTSSVNGLDPRRPMGQVLRAATLATYLVNDAATLSWLTSGGMDVSTPQGQTEAAYRILFGLGNAALTAHTIGTWSHGMAGRTADASPTMRFLQASGLATVAATGIPWTIHDGMNFFNQIAAGDPVSAGTAAAATLLDAAFTYYTAKAATTSVRGMTGGPMPTTSNVAKPMLLLAGALALREIIALAQEAAEDDEPAAAQPANTTGQRTQAPRGEIPARTPNGSQRYATPFDELLKGEQPASQPIILDNGPMRPAREQADAGAMENAAPDQR